MIMLVMKMAVNTSEASLSCPPLTSCCVAQFLTGYGLDLSMAQGLGIPVLLDLTSHSKEDVVVLK